MAEADDHDVWSRFYHANVGRAPRPLFVEALALAAPQPADALRQAVDLGCGDGTETLALLQHGWQVLAIDQQPQALALVAHAVPPELTHLLQTRCAPFEELELSATDFVYAGYSLPFCAPHQFEALWRTIGAALRPGGLLAGQLFGVHDTWATNSAMTFHTRDDVQVLLDGFHVLALREEEEDGHSTLGPKHWHVFHVIARKP